MNNQRYLQLKLSRYIDPIIISYKNFAKVMTLRKADEFKFEFYGQILSMHLTSSKKTPQFNKTQIFFLGIDLVIQMFILF